MDFILFTNFYNEKDKIIDAIESVENWECKPRKWVIIDDGSTDGGGEVLRSVYNNSTLNIVPYFMPKKDEGDLLLLGKTYSEVFNNLNIWNEDYDFMMMLDIDVNISDDYTKHVIEVFENKHYIGVVSGYNLKNVDPKMPCGNTKCVRWDVIEYIGNFGDLSIGLDTYLNIKAAAMDYGWYVKFGGWGEIKAEEGTRNSTEKGAWRAGWQWAHMSGSYLGAFIRFIYRVFKRRYGMAFIKGFLKNMRDDKDFCTDEDVEEFYGWW